MADPWELILHHTYAGTPGVIYDLSPAHGSHGVVQGPVLFLADGAQPGTGAITRGFGKGRVRVKGGRGWEKLDAIRGEIVFSGVSFVVLSGMKYLIDCEQFTVVFSRPKPNVTSFTVVFRAGAWSSAVTAEGTLAEGQWTRLEFEYDGVSRATLSMDGKLAAVKTGVFPPLPGASPTWLTIGSNPDMDWWSEYEGLIDEIKIWRRNPQVLGANFLERPYDKETADCWANWGRAFAEWLQQNAQCGQLFESVTHDLVGAFRTVSADPVLRERLDNAVKKYLTQWHSGNLNSDEMIQALREIANILDAVGIDMHATLDSLFGSECWKQLIAEVPRPDCDKQLTGMLTALAQTLETE
ncbi:LamG-like jellyroll fold domain-containing protein [Rhodococcus sp. WAY2]|uniref:LamG-like jellyroll fold domain-containing protein n=1 Tax=Rhodococcus sp. WAY2 TaxID=2663121 RepID=UPI00135848FB|nr:LamG-like jellyroll fold domain-containing protein [Rhodococcus sp. WAY2]